MTLQAKLTRLLRLHLKSAVAREAGIHPITLSNILHGKRRPSFETASRLARVLCVQLGWLIDDTQGWPPVRVEAQETQVA